MVLDWDEASSEVFRREKFRGEDLYDYERSELELKEIPGGIANRVIKAVPNHSSRAQAPAPVPAPQPGKPLYSSGRDGWRWIDFCYFLYYLLLFWYFSFLFFFFFCSIVGFQVEVVSLQAQKGLSQL